MMLTRLKCGSLTSLSATRCVNLESRYITMTGTPAIAHSRVAVPDDDSAMSAAANASPRSCGMMRTNSCAPRIVSSSSTDEIVGAWITKASISRSFFKIEIASSIAGSSARTSWRREPGRSAIAVGRWPMAADFASANGERPAANISSINGCPTYVTFTLCWR